MLSLINNWQLNKAQKKKKKFKPMNVNQRYLISLVNQIDIINWWFRKITWLQEESFTFVQCLNGRWWKHSEQFRLDFYPLGKRYGGECVSRGTS